MNCRRPRWSTDLELLEEAEKEDLWRFEAVSEMLVQHRMNLFLNQVEEGQLEEQLQDRCRWLHAFFCCGRRGFDFLHRKVSEIVIGVYARKPIGRRGHLTKPVLTFSFSWQLLRYSHREAS